MLPAAHLGGVHIDFLHGSPFLEFLAKPQERRDHGHDGHLALPAEVERDVLRTANDGLSAGRAVVRIGGQ